MENKTKTKARHIYVCTMCQSQYDSLIDLKKESSGVLVEPTYYYLCPNCNHTIVVY